jgi:hypothetical protein
MPNGINRITFYQTNFDPNNDYIEKDEDGNVIDFWADYFTGSEIPQDQTISHFIHGEILFSGSKPEIKLNGSYKKLTVNFFEDEKPIEHIGGEWKFYINDEPIKLDILTSLDSNDVEVNQVKIKLRGKDDLLGEVLKVVYASVQGEYPVTELQIVGL